MMAGQSAWAVQTWKVTDKTGYTDNGRYATFTITRTESTEAETVLYRTIGLTAPAGKYFVEKSGELTFGIGETSKKVVVDELSPEGADLIYYYWTNDVQYRYYRFEVLSQTNDELAHLDRSLHFWSDTYVNSTTMFKDVLMNVFPGPVTVDDASNGFGQAYHAIQINDYFTQSAPQAYLTMIGAKLAMTFDFQAKEKEDGYQYIQVLVDDDTNYDSGNKDGDVGTLEYAQLLAGFGHDPGSKNTHYAKYSFPVPGITDFPLSNYDNRWKSYGNTVGRLYSQKIKPGYLHEPSGRVLADANIKKLGVRFDASGKNDDTWYVQDLNAHIQVIDQLNPTIIVADVRLSPAPYKEGSPFYVTVPFNEIVLVDGTPTITTNWGELTYEMGSCTNVLVFKGTIGTGLDPTAELAITGLSGGPVRDLWGNPFVGDNTIGVTFPAQPKPSEWGGTGTKDDPYLISTCDGLNVLAQHVNSGTDFGPDDTHPDGYFFKLSNDITYENSTSNNYTAIGTPDYPFRSHFDGNNKTVGNICIKSNYSYQGLFGYVGAGGEVWGVELANSSIETLRASNDYAAGIVGCCVGGSVGNCTVYNSTVTCDGSHIGMIVGNSDATQEYNAYYNCTLAGQPVQNIYSVKIDDGITVIGSTWWSRGGTGYYLENTTVLLFPPIGKGFASITVTRNSDKSDVTADVLSGTTIIMPAYDITVSSPVEDVWGIDNGNDGSEDKPYIISSPSGWDALASSVNRGETYSEKFFKLSDDFDNSATPVTKMVGWGKMPFMGTFLGNGRTLTVNLENRHEEEEGCAPFFRTRGANISNLRVAGTITTGNKFAGGIVSHMKQTSLEGCVSSVTIVSSVDGDGTHGGIVGIVEGGLGIYKYNELTGCVFDGVICCTAENLTNSCGGLIGMQDDEALVGVSDWGENLYAPSAIPEGKYPLDLTNCCTFARNGIYGYYTETLGSSQRGHQVYPFDTKPANVSGDVWYDYGLVKTYHQNCGIEYNGKFYARPVTYTLNESGNYSTDVVNGYFANITLDGRTLHKNNTWNTLCLPFNMTAEQIATSDLAGADIRALSSASLANGTLTLNFSAQGDVTSIDAGVPYIIRWGSGDDIVSPTIDAVIIDQTAHDVTCDLGGGKSIIFKGTKSATTFTEEDDTKLFIGSGNKLYYPLSGAGIAAQRAYFQLTGIEASSPSQGEVKEFVLNFGEEDATSLSEELRVKSGEFDTAAGWYTLDGRKLEKQPTAKGLYIHNGKKVLK
jgi:hypothetical protein